MGYLHIQNLYKSQHILMMKQCYAMEKIHGTSTHVAWTGSQVNIFAGGMKHESFVTIFDIEGLTTAFKEHFGELPVTIYGEGYGGKCQGMKETYGDEQRFVAFDVMVGDTWVTVPNAEKIATRMGLDFVEYELISTDLSEIDRCRDKDSTQAIRNGCGEGKIREGVVLRPLEECKLSTGQRLIVKHKRDEFRETSSPRKVIDPELQVKMKEARGIAEEWVTDMRLEHVLDKIGVELDMSSTGKVVRAMMEDVLREGEGEFEDTKAVRKEIGKQAALVFRRKIQGSFYQEGKEDS